MRKTYPWTYADLDKPEQADALVRRRLGDFRAPNDCWLMPGRAEKNGYVHLDVSLAGERRVITAHRLVYLLTYKALPPAPFVVRHLCESRYAPGDITYRRCCNPAHLKEGLPRDNSADMVAAGRNKIGADHGMALFEDDDIVLMRELKAHGWADGTLAQRFGTTKSNVRYICYGVTWPHLPGPRYTPKTRTRITPEVRFGVRMLRAAGWLYKDIGAVLRIHETTASEIVNGKKRIP